MEINQDDLQTGTAIGSRASHEHCLPKMVVDKSLKPCQSWRLLHFLCFCSTLWLMEIAYVQ